MISALTNPATRSEPSEPVAYIEPADLERLKTGESIVFYASDRDKLGIPLYAPTPSATP